MPTEPLRIWRSPYSNFYDEETLHAAEKYTPPALRAIADAGFNAIWIHAILRDVVPSPAFPELGKNSAAHLRSLRAVIRRASKEGIRVLLYMQPPRGFEADDPFWTKHPEVAGATWRYPYIPLLRALCTSTTEGKAHLRGCAETLARRLPELGGVILITASEFQAHCYSHYNARKRFVIDADPGPALDCPRCAGRHPSDVASEVIRLVRDGVRESGSGARVIAWNWSWTLYEPDPAKRILQQLPKDVTLMAGFERGDTKTILGKQRVIDEYSLSFAGPSSRFKRTLQACRKRGLRVMAKLQIGTTHELATVPNLPLIGNLYDKAKAMRRLRVKDFMGCWNFGNMVTANTAAFARFMTIGRLPPCDRALREFASAYLPGCNPVEVAGAWETFARTMDSYPFCIPFLYYGPVNYAVALPIEAGPLKGEPVGRSWHDDPRGDELSKSLGPFTLDEIVRGLKQLTEEWEEGAARFVAAVESCKSQKAAEESNSVLATGHCFRSAWNIYRAYKLRRYWKKKNLPALLRIAADEYEHLVEALPLIDKDPRLGFHSECQVYLFTAEAIRKKLGALKALLF